MFNPTWPKQNSSFSSSHPACALQWNLSHMAPFPPHPHPPTQDISFVPSPTLVTALSVLGSDSSCGITGMLASVSSDPPSAAFRTEQPERSLWKCKPDCIPLLISHSFIHSFVRHLLKSSIMCPAPGWAGVGLGMVRTKRDRASAMQPTVCRELEAKQVPTQLKTKVQSMPSVVKKKFNVLWEKRTEGWER